MRLKTLLLTGSKVDKSAQSFWKAAGVSCGRTQQGGFDDSPNRERTALAREPHLPDVQYGMLFTLRYQASANEARQSYREQANKLAGYASRFNT